jgi:hypothetical protein
MAMKKISDSNADQRKFACKQMRLALKGKNEVPICFIAATLAIEIGPEESVTLSLRNPNLTNEEQYLLACLYVNYKTPKHLDYFLAKTIVEADNENEAEIMGEKEADRRGWPNSFRVADAEPID